ncbi:hypothetical protein A1Q2_03645 [Trichosporon asahii var. asahii CBS 8904]|uniref:Uncharacterized protein n=1 Tax=Trichosporon asahii var. asahii (strain CBS 8904) TaxID=1220162 RepID=K1VN18_TRIAC|nr:hypothetical protein A1Q2_03645 [Trichosporon asahii var. asahii CBS 8904]
MSPTPTPLAPSILPNLDERFDELRDLHMSDLEAAKGLRKVAGAVRNFSYRTQAQELRRGALQALGQAEAALRFQPAKEEGRLRYRVAELEAERAGWWARANKVDLGTPAPEQHPPIAVPG